MNSRSNCCIQTILQDFSFIRLRFIVSIHAAALTVSKLLFGVAADRTSNLKLLTGGVIVCSTTSICLAFANTVSQISLIMLMIGCMQGAAWVPATKLVAMWFDDSSYATMFSVLGCASTLAGLLLPFLKDFYWRTVEFNCGVSVLIIGVVCRILIGETTVVRKKEQSKAENDIGLKNIVKSSVIWHIALVYFFSMEMRTICETWVPLYLSDRNIISNEFQVLYELGGLIGTIVSGLIVDSLASRYGVDKSRRGVGIVCSILMMTFAIALFRFEEHASWIGFVTGLFVNGSINVWCLIGSQSGTDNIAGTCSAFISFIATCGSIFAGSPLASLIATHGYSVFTTLFITQIVFVISISSMRIPLRMKNIDKKDL